MIAGCGWCVCVRVCCAAGGYAICCVCVSVVVVCGRLACVLGAGSGTKAAVGIAVMPLLLMTSIISLSYFAAFICLLIVLALTILPEMPEMFSLVDVSLPSQIAGKNRASVFGICFAVGNL